MKVSAYVGPMTAKEAHLFLSLMRKSARVAPSYYHLSQSISCTLPAKELPPCRDCQEGRKSSKMQSPNLKISDECLKDCSSGERISFEVEWPMMKIEGTIAQKPDGTESPVETDSKGKDRLDSLINSIERMFLDEDLAKPNQLFQSSMDVLKGAKMVSNFPKPNVKSIREAAMRMEDPLTGLERVARIKAKDMGIPMKQQWSFLNTYIDVTTDEGLSVLEDHLNNIEQKKDSSACDGVIRDENGKVDICKTLMSLKISEDLFFDPKEEEKESSDSSRRNSSSASTNGSQEIFEDCETKEVFIHG